MTQVRTAQIMDAIQKAYGRTPMGREAETFYKSLLEKFDGADNRVDGYIDTTHSRRIFRILKGTSPSEWPSSLRDQSFAPEKTVVEQIILRKLFPRPVLTAEAFLARNLLSVQKALDRSIDGHLCLPAVQYRERRLEVEAVKSDFKSLPAEEKKRALPALIHLRYEMCLVVLRILFGDEFKKIPDEPTVEAFRKVLGDVENLVKAWRTKRADTDSVRLAVLRRLVYLTTAVYRAPAKEEILMRKEAHGVLPQAYERELFDTDLDGVVDALDAFPISRIYARDTNQDQIPDELTAQNRGPQNLWGMGKDESRIYTDGSNKKRLELHRIGNRLYLVVNVTLKPATPKVQKSLPFRRFLWKKRVEREFRRMVSPRLGPLTVLVNFHTGEGSRVDVFEGSALQLTHGDGIKEVVGALMYTWPILSPVRTITHEVGHFLFARDRSPKTYELKRADLMPGLRLLVNQNHLMGARDALRFDPVDFSLPLDVVSDQPTLRNARTMGRAEAFFAAGDYQNAEKLFFELYTQLRPPLGTYFKGDVTTGEQLDKRRAAKAALTGMILCRIRRFERSRDPQSIPIIGSDLKILEAIGVNHRSAPEAQEAYVDAKVLASLLARAQGDRRRARLAFREAQRGDKINHGRLTHLKMKYWGAPAQPH